MTRDDLRALRELANAAVDPHTLPPTMSEAYGALLLKLIKEHETPWTDAHWTEYERSIVAAEREKCAKECDAVVDQLRALHRATMGYEDACVLRGAELVADALREGLEGKK